MKQNQLMRKKKTNKKTRKEGSMEKYSYTDQTPSCSSDLSKSKSKSALLSKTIYTDHTQEADIAVLTWPLVLQAMRCKM